MLLGNYRLDQWILGAVSGSRELGLYSVAVAWAEALWQLPTALSPPCSVRTSSAPQPARRLGRLRPLSGRPRRSPLVLAVVFIAAAPILCVTFFGESFRGSIGDLRVLVLGAFGVVALKQLGSVLTGQGKPTLASLAIGISFVATVAPGRRSHPRRSAGLGPRSRRASPTRSAASRSLSSSRGRSAAGSPSSSRAERPPAIVARAPSPSEED